jgi:hypothetical protein
MRESRYNSLVEKEKAISRRSWPVRVYRLGDEPGDDLSASTTAEQRLAMMWPLTVEAWALAGLPLPTYARSETPITFRPLSGTDATGQRS